MIVAYFLEMTNIPSWNGKWTGSDRIYVRVRKYTKARGTKIMEGSEEIVNKVYEGSYFTTRKLVSETKTGQYEKSWHYNWNDGWGCNVVAKTVDGKTATKLRKASCGFCGYEWMIDSIESKDEIQNSEGE